MYSLEDVFSFKAPVTKTEESTRNLTGSTAVADRLKIDGWL